MRVASKNDIFADTFYPEEYIRHWPALSCGRFNQNRNSSCRLGRTLYSPHEYAIAKCDLMLQNELFMACDNLEKGRVLVVDDEQMVRDAVRIVLVSNGYDVQTAVDGHQALASLDAGEFNLVILDFEMPNMKGDLLAKSSSNGVRAFR